MERPAKRHKQESPYSVEESVDLSDDTPGLPTGVHKKNKSGPGTLQRLHSCERFFCSQTLDEPPPEPLAGSPIPTGNETVAPSGRDFCISYSQNYVYRKNSSSQDHQSQLESPDGSGPSSWESEQSSVRHPALWGGQERGDGAQQQPQQDPSTTPELCGEPNQGSPQPKKYFSLFRPAAEWKTLHLVRHGESEYNAATLAKEGFSDPLIYNPKLTAKGRKQAQKLQESLAKLKISKDALWVCSPMTRAMETMMLGCPHAARIGAPARPLKVAVRGELAEQMMTTGDIGLPASHLRKTFPQLSEAMEGLPERWWFRHDENDAQLKRFTKHENKAHMQARVGEFRKWVQSRPEKVIIAFGHSVLFKELSGGHKSLKNCEIRTISI